MNEGKNEKDKGAGDSKEYWKMKEEKEKEKKKGV